MSIVNQLPIDVMLFYFSSIAIVLKFGLPSTLSRERVTHELENYRQVVFRQVIDRNFTFVDDLA